MFCLSLIEVYWIAVAKKKIFADLGKRMAVFLWGNGKHCKGKPRPKIILRQTGNQSQEIEKSFGAEWKINLSQTIFRCAPNDFSISEERNADLRQTKSGIQPDL